MLPLTMLWRRRKLLSLLMMVLPALWLWLWSVEMARLLDKLALMGAGLKASGGEWRVLWGLGPSWALKAEVREEVEEELEELEEGGEGGVWELGRRLWCEESMLE